jgi:F-type H+-transporting ATPase subunit b
MSLLSILAADPAETHHWLLPETAEFIYGGIASVLVIGALVKFAGPQFTKFLNARTERIQKELDGAANALSQATQEATSIRAAIGDIAGERNRLVAEADQQAATMLTEGRARIAAEVAELEARGDAEIAASRSRSSDELRGEISVLASQAAQRAVSASLNASAQQELIENFINSVGAAR